MDKNTHTQKSSLRRQAEERLAARPSTSTILSQVDAIHLVHELQVHQIELEMQNEELQQSHAQVETALQRYSDLYDFAPVGYLLLDHLGIILQANLTGANMFEVNRADLVGRRLGMFVAVPDRAVLNAFMVRAFADDAKQVCEVTLVQTLGQSQSNCLFVRLEGSVPENRHECLVTVIDITERKQAEQALLENNQRMKGIIEGTYAGTWEWNVQTGETIFNAVWAQLIGYTLEELAPVSIKTWEQFAHPDDLKKSYDLLERHFAGELPHYNCEIRMRHKDGHWVWINNRGRVITRTADGKPLMMFGTHIDITERKLTINALQRLATTDALTGLHNRHHFIELASGELKRAARHRQPPALAMLDVDGLKHVNDTYGHAAGDQVLVTFSEVCQQHVRDIDVFARIGGDEFALLLPETTSEEAYQVVERVRLVLATRPLELDGQQYVVTFSAGIAGMAHAHETLDALLARADMAMYRAKDAGRNRIAM